MRSIVILVLVSCSAREAPPMAGDCADHVVPNVFGGSDEVVPYKECRWEGKTWVCRLEHDALSWRCVAVTR